MEKILITNQQKMGQLIQMSYSLYTIFNSCSELWMELDWMTDFYMNIKFICSLIRTIIIKSQKNQSDQRRHVTQVWAVHHFTFGEWAFLRRLILPWDKLKVCILPIRHAKRISKLSLYKSKFLIEMSAWNIPKTSEVWNSDL